MRIEITANSWFFIVYRYVRVISDLPDTISDYVTMFLFLTTNIEIEHKNKKISPIT